MSGKRFFLYLIVVNNQVAKKSPKLQQNVPLHIPWLVLVLFIFFSYWIFLNTTSLQWIYIYIKARVQKKKGKDI